MGSTGAVLRIAGTLARQEPRRRRDHSVHLHRGRVCDADRGAAACGRDGMAGLGDCGFFAFDTDGAGDGSDEVGAASGA